MIREELYSLKISKKNLDRLHITKLSHLILQYVTAATVSTVFYQ
jgi:hypothetical protein